MEIKIILEKNNVLLSEQDLKKNYVRHVGYMMYEKLHGDFKNLDQDLKSYLEDNFSLDDLDILELNPSHRNPYFLEKERQRRLEHYTK